MKNKSLVAYFFLPDFWQDPASGICKKNALSSGYQYHMGHLILYILKSYSTTKVMLITMQNLCIVICIQNWILLCECGHWGYPILGLPHTDKVKTILWFMTTLLKTRDMVLHPFLINLDRAHYLYDISLFTNQIYLCRNFVQRISYL